MELWERVDDYLMRGVGADDAVLAATLHSIERAGMPSISVSPLQGKMLSLLTRVTGAARVLELGTLGGYSTICLARALPPAPTGRLLSLEINPAFAELARQNVARARLERVVEVRVGAAAELLPGTRGEPPFDLAFIDADKQSTPEYFEACLGLVRPGGIIIVDNVVREGNVIDGTSADPAIVGIRRFLGALRGDPRVDASAIQTVGLKGHDGFVLAVVKNEQAGATQRL